MKALLSDILSALCVLILSVVAGFFTCITVVGYACNVYSLFTVVFVVIFDICVSALTTMWFIAILRSCNGKKEE